MDTAELSKPQGYLIYTLYDAKMNIIPSASGVIRVEGAGQLATIAKIDLKIPASGYMQIYVANASTDPVSFDNLTVVRIQGMLRATKDYYPYGMELDGINPTSDDYAYGYSGKELQENEYKALGGSYYSGGITGLDVNDLEARFYDPAIGRWSNPDPAEQFANPYMAMANSPVVKVDPNGQFIPPVIIAGDMIAVQLGWLTVSSVTATTIAVTAAMTSMTVTATATGIAYAASTTMGAGASSPTGLYDHYYYDPNNPNQPLQWVSDEGRNQGLDYITNTVTNQTIKLPYDPSRQLLETVDMPTKFMLNDPLYQYHFPAPASMSSIPPGPINVVSNGPTLQPLGPAFNSPLGEASDGQASLPLFFGGTEAAANAIAMQKATFRLTNGAYNGSKFSPWIYSSGWRGGSTARISTYAISGVGKAISMGAGAANTAFAYNRLLQGDRRPITWLDAGVGTAGLTSDVAPFLGYTEVPVVGEAAGIYGFWRFAWDLGEIYHPIPPIYTW